jgi:phosphoglycolate phosphatase
MPAPYFILDLDGTLVDSAPDIARALNATLTEAGFPPLALPEVIGRVGDGAGKLVERSLPPGAAADVAALTRKFRDHYALAVCVDSRPYDGVLPALAALVKGGVRLGVLTNKPSDLARRLLQALGFDAVIADVVGDGDGFPRKPAPDAALALLARAGLEAARASVWVVGDGLPDLQLARALGCRAAAVAWGYKPRTVLAAQGPDRILDRPEQLLTLLEPAAGGA